MIGSEAHFLQACIAEFRRCKTLGDGALAQADDDAFFAPPSSPGGNNMAIVVKHVAGNLRSRWTDFLTSDGEKPDRDRDGEFELRPGDSRDSLIRAWEDGWNTLFATLGALTSEDLARTVAIRGEPHTVPLAVLRQVAHYAYHVGQMVLLAREARGDRWKSLSVPRGGSREFNERMRERFGQPDGGNPGR